MKYALLYKNGTTSLLYNQRQDIEGLTEMLCIHSQSHYVVGILIIKPKKNH